MIAVSCPTSGWMHFQEDSDQAQTHNPFDGLEDRLGCAPGQTQTQKVRQLRVANTAKREVLHVSQGNLKHKHRLGEAWMRAALRRRAWVC